MVSRDAECAAVARFLDAATREPSSLLIEGEAGIGKTTIWLAGVEQARERDFHVLATRPAQTESVLSYVALADLLSRVDATVLNSLPHPQRLALDRVLLRGDAGDAPTDPRAVAAAFLSVIETLAEVGPVLIGIDDLQWLDPSSAAAVAFAARRLSGAVGVITAMRSDASPALDLFRDRLPRPESSRRLVVGPLSLGALRTIVARRLGLSLPRPTMVRIHDISRGNPFYALQLAYSSVDGEISMQTTLSDLVRARVSELGTAAREALLAAACAGSPTIDLIARALNVTHSRAAEILDEAEGHKLIHYEGHRVRFSHPLLAAGIHADARRPGADACTPRSPVSSPSQSCGPDTSPCRLPSQTNRRCTPWTPPRCRRPTEARPAPPQSFSIWPSASVATLPSVISGQPDITCTPRTSTKQRRG